MKATSDVISIGVLGAGRISNGVHIPILREMPGVRIAWLCDQVGERAAATARNWKVRQAFDKLQDCPSVDAVLVAIPVGRRREALAHIFDQGWHAFMEKPVAVTADDHVALVRDAERANVEVGVGLMRRFYRSTNLARLALEARVFGAVREVWAAEAARSGTTGREGAWYQADLIASGGGVLMERGSHLIDQVFHILGVEAFENLEASFTKADGIDLEARTVAQIRCAGANESIPLHVIISRIRDVHPGLVICCEHATIRFGMEPDAVVDVLDRNDKVVCRLDGGTGVTNLYQAFFREWQAFLEQCRLRKPSLVDASSALLSTRFIEAAYDKGSGRAA
jgi:predicted dehydrogenase